MFFIPETDFKISRAIVLAVLVSMMVAGPVLSADSPVVWPGTITAYKLNVRSHPSRTAGVIATLNKGTRVGVLEIKGGVGGWVTILYQGREGYVRNRPKYIAIAQVPTAQQTQAPLKTLKPKTDKPEKVPALKRKAIAEKLEKETRKMDRFSKREAEILNGLNEIDFSLNRSRIRAQTLARETGRLAREIEAIQGQIKQLNLSMSQTQVYAGQRLEALYRMHMMGRLEMAGPPSSVFDFMVTQQAVKTVVASDYDLLAEQSDKLARLTHLKKELEEQVSAKTVLEDELAVQIRIKEKESGKKEAILKEIRQQKQLSQAAIASLEQAAKDLRSRLDAMGLSGSPALDDTTFSRQKGRLSPPVTGKIISRFGRSRKGNYNSFTFQSGIDIKVERGEPVRSVFKGEVMFADWLKGYGNLLILNHGDNYYTLYAHVEEMFKKKGETVGTGEVIATAGDSGSIKGMCLHFEVRHHGKPVNPMTWLKKGA